MERSQFTFYESFAKALSRIKNKTVRCTAYDAICAYALRGELPDLEALPDAAAIAFDLIKPTLDAAARMAEGGKKSMASRKGSSKVSEGSAEGSGNKGENENENEGEKEGEKEIENENERSLVKSARGARARKKRETFEGQPKVRPEDAAADLARLERMIAQLEAK